MGTQAKEKGPCRKVEDVFLERCKDSKVKSLKAANDVDKVETDIPAVSQLCLLVSFPGLLRISFSYSAVFKVVLMVFKRRSRPQLKPF